MAMYVYKYVFNKHVIGWWFGRGSGADSGINYRGVPCIGIGSEDPQGPQRVQDSAQWGKGAESSWSSWELGIWGAYNHNEYKKNVN